MLGEVDCPDTYLSVQGPNAELRLSVLRRILQVARAWRVVKSLGGGGGGWGKRDDSVVGVESIRIYTCDRDKEMGHIIAREQGSVQVGKEKQPETHTRRRQSLSESDEGGPFVMTEQRPRSHPRKKGYGKG
jgi:hypothetical protein